MTNEIDKDFYCTRYREPHTQCDITCVKDHCEHYHRKHPTPEQYKDEYGEELPANFPVWWFNVRDGKWELGVYNLVLEYTFADLVVCACTPYGKPDDDRRPK